MGSSPKIRAPRGMTLIELLVVIAIIGILAGLTVPAIMAAREATRRARCAGNLKQLGIASSSYHDAVGGFPPGRVMTYDTRYAGSSPPCISTIVDQSFLVRILPFVEQSPLFNSINHGLSIFSSENATCHGIAVGCFSCPSDSGSGSPRLVSPGSLVTSHVPDPDGRPRPAV